MDPYRVETNDGLGMAFERARLGIAVDGAPGDPATPGSAARRDAATACRWLTLPVAAAILVVVGAVALTIWANDRGVAK